MKTILLTIVAPLFAVMLPCSAGDILSVRGRVVEKSSGAALGYVTVAIADTSGHVLDGSTSDSLGCFSLCVPDLEKGDRGHQLIYSFVGFCEFRSVFADAVDRVEGGVAHLHDVQLEEDPQMLAGAVVAGKRPLLEHRFDRIVLNVSELAVAQTGNALDVLKSSPGVTIDKDGNVKLNGQTVSVWIDGRPSQMSGKDLETYLKGSTGDMIEKVELISNPSSKYDAEGSGGIINIKTKKGFLKGLNGSLMLNAGMDFFPSVSWNGSVSTNVVYRTDKTSTSFSYSPRYNGRKDEADEYKIYGEGNTSRQNSHSEMEGYGMFHNVSVGNDWKISGKDVLGVMFKAVVSDSESHTMPGSTVSDYRNCGTPGEYLYSRLCSATDDTDRSRRYSANVNYTRTFDASKMQELTLNADYDRTDGRAGNVQRNIFDRTVPSGVPDGLEDYGFDDHTARTLDLYSLKADYSQIFWKGTGRVEAGAKAAISNTVNWFGKYDYIYDALQSSGTLSDVPSERNDFTYNEQVYAAYVNVAKQFSQKWNAQLGIRGEYTVQIGDWMTGTDPDGIPAGTERTSRDYMDVFPTAFVSYMASPKAILTASYAYRIGRPKYWQMNPFRQYINATTYSQGDPALSPSYSQNASVSAVLFSRMTISLGYSHNRNYSEMQVPVYDLETGMMGLVYANSGVQQGAFASLSVSEQPIFKWWNITFNGTYYYNSFRAYPGVSVGMGDEFSNRGGAFYGYFSTTFFLPKSFKLSVDGWGATSQAAGYYTIGNMLMLGFNAEKSFWDGKGNLALRINDFANTFRTNVYIRKDGVTSYRLRNGAGNMGVSLSFIWRFGTAVSSSRRNVGKLDEDSRM
ncbi:MAG: TonB-dependent receptor [Clostridium sp.]|nr:TonB-dependent receptor [Bacteroides sp.]MCM1197381.1 TonB-dependent receptor [Clostridium sp.]